MNRRTLLLGAGITGLTPFAGCLGGATPSDEADDSEDRYAVMERSRRSEPPPTSSYPHYGDRVERMIGYDEIEPDEADIYLEPSTRTIEPGESIAFSLENGGEETLKLNFYNWRIHTWADDEWRRVAPQGVNDPLMQLAPGERHTWTVTIDNDGIEEGAAVPPAGGTDEVDVSALGAGHYVFGTSGWWEGESHEEQIAFVARFELDAEPLQLTPTNAIQETEWDGDTLVATSDRHGANDRRLGAYDLSHVDEPTAEPRRMLTEHVLRHDQLRDTLALALEHDARRVRLEEYNGWFPIFGVHDVVSYEFRGEFFDVTAHELDD